MNILFRALRSITFRRSGLAKRLPQALIIGAQKSGTSALFSYLSQHPQLEGSREKEVDFFGSDLLYGRGLPWYASNWRDEAPADALRFEASGQYLVMPKACGQIRACLPKVKLIAILREPVERAYSSWLMYRRHLARDPDFFRRYYQERCTAEERSSHRPRAAAEFEDFYLALQHEAENLRHGLWTECGILSLGLYGPQLRRFYDAFSHEQLLVLDSEDLRTDRIATLNQVLDFLGLPAWDWAGADLTDVFVGETAPPMPSRARDFLQEYYRESNCILQELLESPPWFARLSASSAA